MGERRQKKTHSSKYGEREKKKIPVEKGVAPEKVRRRH